MLATKQFRPLDAHKGEDLAFEPLRHILTGKDMLLYHAGQFSRGGWECPTSSAAPSRCASRGQYQRTISLAKKSCSNQERWRKIEEQCVLSSGSHVAWLDTGVSQKRA